MQPYFKTDYVRIDFHAGSNAVVLVWLRLPLSGEFRDSMDKILEAEGYFKTGKLIIDITHHGSISFCHQEWLKSDWTKRAIKDGHTHTAIVMSPDNFSSISTNDNIPQVSGKVVGYFDEMSRALEWISQF